MKVVAGYMRNVPGGDGVPSISCAILDDVTGDPIPSGGMIKADPSPVTTDGNGYFRWTSELSPGPLRVRGDIVPGTNVRIRSGAEVMQAEDMFLSDIPDMFRVFSTGVYKGYLNALGVTASGSTLEVTVATGAAILNGVLWEIITPRTLTVPANTTLASRRDYVVLRQWIAGSYSGKQDLALIQGTVTGVDPTINTDPNILDFPIARVTTAQNAGTSVVTDLRVYAGVRSVVDGAIEYSSLSAAAQSTIAENVFDSIAASLIAGSGLIKTTNDAGNTTTLAIAAAGIISSMIATGAITSDKILDGTITGYDIANQTINSQHIFPGAIGTAQLASASVTQDKLAAGAGFTGLHAHQFDTAILAARAVTGSISNVDTVSLTMTSGVQYDVFALLLGRAEGTAVSGPGSGNVHVVLNGDVSVGLPFLFDNGVDSSFFNVNLGTFTGPGTITAGMTWDNIFQRFNISTGRLILMIFPRS